MAAATGLGIKLATGANALDTAAAIKSKLAQLQPFFPQGLKVVYPYDTTPFVKISIHEVVKTLFEAIVLVFPVMYLFLQNLRATLIPTIAVPVVLLGTFAVLAAFGFSINTLTMFGMVLAIGLLVDDAIVVVENVERVMVEDKLPPKRRRRSQWSKSGRSGGHCHGAFGGIYSDGILWWFNRGYLSPVLADHCLRDGLVGTGGVDINACSLCNAAQTGFQRTS